MGVVIVGPWKARPRNGRIEHERHILERIAELNADRIARMPPQTAAMSRESRGFAFFGDDGNN